MVLSRTGLMTGADERPPTHLPASGELQEGGVSPRLEATTSPLQQCVDWPLSFVYMDEFTNSFNKYFWVPAMCLALFWALRMQHLTKSSPCSHEAYVRMGGTEHKQICNVSGGDKCCEGE